jgi:hypothetical protein
LTPLFLHLYSAPCSVESNLVPRLFQEPGYEVVWKVGIVQLGYWECIFDAFYIIFTIKFSKSRPRNFQTFQ